MMNSAAVAGTSIALVQARLSHPNGCTAWARRILIPGKDASGHLLALNAFARCRKRASRPQLELKTRKKSPRDLIVYRSSHLCGAKKNSARFRAILWSFTDCLEFCRIRIFMDQKRIAQRHRVLKAGTIEFNGGGIDCTLRNVSETGAALEVESPIGIPERFTLASNGSRRPCRVVWRKEKRIGVAFD
jgi:PilZ domain